MWKKMMKAALGASLLSAVYANSQDIKVQAESLDENNATTAEIIKQEQEHAQNYLGQGHEKEQDGEVNEISPTSFNALAGPAEGQDKQLEPDARSSQDLTVDLSAKEQATELNLATSPEPSGAAEDLIISEYIEGSSQNKAVEIYNGTAEEIDLTPYRLELYSNGKSSAQSTYEMEGSLAAGQVFVVAHKQASESIKEKAHALSDVVNFNGDDYIQLLKNNELIDNIGHFSSRTNNLKDLTLVRKPTITQGNIDPTSATDIEAEWIAYPKDTVSQLGQHSMVKAEKDEPLKESLLFSSIVEGSGNEKAIEIYNGTGQAVNLADYQIELYSNSNTEANHSFIPTGQLDHGQYYLIVHDQAEIPQLVKLADIKLSTITNFNGNDSLVLKKGDQIIDSFGQLVDRTNHNKDKTLYRKGQVTSGDTNIRDEFDPSLEWEIVSKNHINQLGKLSQLKQDPTQPNEGNQPHPDQGQEIQTISIAQARLQDEGKRVQVKGVVNGQLKNTVHVEDESGGLAIHPADSVDIQVGDQVLIQGKLADFNGLLQIQDVKVLDRQAGSAPKARVTDASGINEENESRLAQLSGVQIVDIDGQGASWTNYIAQADGETFLIRDERNQLDLKLGQTYDSIAGIIQQFGSDYQILPRGVQDVLADASVTQAPTSLEKAQLVPTGSVVKLVTATPDAVIYYTLDGSQPTKDSFVYKDGIQLEKTGPVVIHAIAKHKDLEASPQSSFHYQVYDSQQGLNIHHIQGTGHQSPLINQRVENIEGIVTAQYIIGSSAYIHIQNPDHKVDDDLNSSEAIVVYTGTKSNHPQLEKGDLVSVNGRVDEYWIEGFWSDMKEKDLPVTQINARKEHGGQVRVLSKGHDLPSPIVIESIPAEVSSKGNYHDGFARFDRDKYAMDYWESLEGMRVALDENMRAVAPQEHGDLWTVKANQSPETQAGGVLLTETDQNTEKIAFKPYPNRSKKGQSGRDFDVITGDYFKASKEDPITGVVMYDFGHYKIYNDLKDMKTRYQKGLTKPQQATRFEQAEDKLTVGVYNLENYSANTDARETPEIKAQRLAHAIGQVMNTPDIVGLTEVQDNNGQEAGGGSKADQSYQRLIDDIKELTGVEYAYLNIDPEHNQDGGAPNANIRVGFLYNPERVTPIKAPSGGASDAVSFDGEDINLNPGRIDPTNSAFSHSRKPLVAEFTFNSTQDDVIVIVNHWNSKGGDDGIYGQNQPPVLSSQIQREKQAQAVAKFIEDVKTQKAQANIVAIGDFNDFQWTKPLQLVEEAGMTNMVNTVDEAYRYSYVYNGNSQTLDHAFVSDHLADQTDIEMLKINADFTDQSGRASDHDPIILQIDFSEQEEQEPAANYRVKESMEVEDIPFERIRRENAHLPVGQKRLIQKGINGKKTTPIIEYYDADSFELIKRELGEPNIVNPVNEIIEIGTAQVEEPAELEKYYFNVKFNDETKEFTTILADDAATDADSHFRKRFAATYPNYKLTLESIQANRFNYKASQAVEDQTEENIADTADYVFGVIDQDGVVLRDDSLSATAEEAERAFSDLYIEMVGQGYRFDREERHDQTWTLYMTKQEDEEKPVETIPTEPSSKEDSSDSEDPATARPDLTDDTDEEAARDFTDLFDFNRMKDYQDELNAAGQNQSSQHSQEEQPATPQRQSKTDLLDYIDFNRMMQLEKDLIESKEDVESSRPFSIDPIGRRTFTDGDSVIIPLDTRLDGQLATAHSHINLTGLPNGLKLDQSIITGTIMVADWQEGEVSRDYEITIEAQGQGQQASESFTLSVYRKEEQSDFEDLFDFSSVINGRFKKEEQSPASNDAESNLNKSTLTLSSVLTGLGLTMAYRKRN